MRNESANGMAWWSAVLLLAVALCSSHAAARPLPEKQTIAITDVTVIDVEHGRSLDSRTVLISDGHISAIVASRDAAIPASAISLSGRGKFLIPGLVDMHVHLFNLSSKRAPNDWTFPLFIANGVTGVRDMRADSPSITQVNAWRKRVNAGELASPHIFATGISVRGASPEDAARQVDAAKEAGADFIKVFSEVPENHWRAIIATAQSRSLPVAGHVPAGVPLLTAATAGQRSNEHLMQAYEACSSVEAGLLATRQGLAGDALAAKRDAQEAQALEAFDHAKCSRVAKSLAASGQVQVPTMVLANEDAMQKRGPPDSDERWRFLRADERERWQRFVAGYTADDAALEKLRHPIARKIVSIMHRAGVPIMTGTDSPMPGVYPGFSLHEEMAMLVDAGLTPREALRSATLVPAQFLGLAATTGSVDVGKRADLVLLDADPAKNIRNTRRIHAVLIDGRLLRRGDLDELLEETALAQSR